MKNSPERKCAGCQKTAPRNEFIRILKENSSGNIIIEPNTKQFGRSVYICKKEDCLKNALKKNRLAKNLRTTIEQDIIKKLKNLLNSR